MAPDLRTVTEVRGARGSVRRSIFLDGERWRDAPSPVLKSLGVSPGQQVDPDALEDSIEMVAASCARDRAYRLLGYRDRSSAELRDRLLDDGYPPAIADELVASLVASGIVDDQRFARSLATSLVACRGFGRHRALREMAHRGVTNDLACEALDELAPADRERDRAAEAALRLRRAGDTPPRLAGRLVRRGFSTSDAYDAASSALRESCDPRVDPGCEGP